MLRNRIHLLLEGRAQNVQNSRQIGNVGPKERRTGCEPACCQATRGFARAYCTLLCFRRTGENGEKPLVLYLFYFIFESSRRKGFCGLCTRGSSSRLTFWRLSFSLFECDYHWFYLSLNMIMRIRLHVSNVQLTMTCDGFGYKACLWFGK